MRSPLPTRTPSRRSSGRYTLAAPQVRPAHSARPLSLPAFRAAAIIALSLGAATLRAQAVHREVSLTVDDLPAMSAGSLNAGEITEMNKKLLAALRAENIPAIGFVNEERLYKTGEVDARIAVLNAWLDAGFDLGNHTFSHTSLNRVELKDWEDDVVQGESVTRMLLRSHRKTLRYLRHPYLDTGPDLATRRQAEAFLTGRGYRVAPVTIDPLDWYFAEIYDKARQHADHTTQDKLVNAWLAYTGAIFAQAEQTSHSLLDYEPKQVLLLHDTWLEADHLSDLTAMLHKRGYTFVSLDEALTDQAYALPDEYVSDVGATWLVHWAVTRGRPPLPAEQPTLPGWVKDLHGELAAP